MTAAAVRPEQPTGMSLVRQQVSAILMSDEAKTQIAPLLSPGISLERVVSTIYQVVADNPELLECTPASLIMAVGKGVKWDLDFGETVHLVPFNVNLAKKDQPARWEKRAKAIRDFKGDIELVVRSGAARAVDAQCFYENEHFIYHQGTTPSIEHHPIVDPVKRGKMLGAYAWATISVRTPLKISVMSVAEIDAIRQEKSKSWKSGPLLAWYARKTVVHQVTKAIPKNPRLIEVLRDFEKEDDIPDADFEVVTNGAVSGSRAGSGTNAASPGGSVPAEVPAAASTPPDYLTPPDNEVMTLEQAKLTKLAGPPGSWSGRAGELLDSFSSKHLESIRTWCATKIEEAGTDEVKESMVNAITLILDDRSKNQTVLDLDSAKTADAIEAKQAAKKKGDLEEPYAGSAETHALPVQENEGENLMTGPIFFAIPKGTSPAVCKAVSCRRAIYWIETSAGKRMPIDVDVPNGKPPTKMLPGHGVPHWGTCPEAKAFKKVKA